jgi:hypothetical protein
MWFYYKLYSEKSKSNEDEKKNAYAGKKYLRETHEQI